jgi:hypothetical protein
MLSTKIRTILITLIAASILAATSVVPAVSHAMTKQEFVQRLASKTDLSR